MAVVGLVLDAMVVQVEKDSCKAICRGRKCNMHEVVAVGLSD